MKKKQEIFSYDEVLKHSIEYFRGDELAATTWINKYAMKDLDGRYRESCPEDMHRRMAAEFARKENEYKSKLSPARLRCLSQQGRNRGELTEEKIFTTLEKNMQGKTVILITHRFSTVKNADKILMLEHGRIIEHGSHRELMQLDRKYAELFNMQAKRYLNDQ